MHSNNKAYRGFTLIELLIVITIIGILSAVTLVALDTSREKGRDSHRKSQFNEVLKALELYYTHNGHYPEQTTGTEGFLADIDSTFYGDINSSMRKLPANADTDYYYCVSTDQRSMLLAVNTENDRGGTDFCSVTRGAGPDYGCLANLLVDAGGADASDNCSHRF